MTWQPIETAPKGLIEVLVFVPEHAPLVFTAKCIYGRWGCSSAGRFAPEDDFYGDAPINPTHWMPLPEAPKGENDE